MVCQSGGYAELTGIAQLFKKQTGTTVTLNQHPYDGLSPFWRRCRRR